MDNNGASAEPTGLAGAEAPEPHAGLGPSDGIPSAWPLELTPELADILGRQCFTFIKLAQLYRAAGFDIPHRAEAEQAYFIHKMLTAWFRHGAGWFDALTDDLREVHAQAAIEASPKARPAAHRR